METVGYEGDVGQDDSGFPSSSASSFAVGDDLPALEARCDAYIAAGRFHDAQRVMDRIKSLRLDECNRIERALQQKFLADRQLLLEDQSNELTEFNQVWNDRTIQLQNQTEAGINELDAKHRQEINEFRAEMQEKYSVKKPKFSKHVLELRHVLDLLVNNRDFARAEVVRVQLEDLEQAESMRLRQEYSESFRKQESVITKRQQQERDVLIQRFQMQQLALESDRQAQWERLIQHHQNVHQDLNVFHRKSLSKTRDSIERQSSIMLGTPKRVNISLANVLSSIRPQSASPNRQPSAQSISSPSYSTNQSSHDQQQQQQHQQQTSPNFGMSARRSLRMAGFNSSSSFSSSLGTPKSATSDGHSWNGSDLYFSGEEDNIRKSHHHHRLNNNNRYNQRSSPPSSSSSGTTTGGAQNRRPVSASARIRNADNDNINMNDSNNNNSRSSGPIPKSTNSPVFIRNSPASPHFQQQQQRRSVGGGGGGGNGSSSSSSSSSSLLSPSSPSSFSLSSPSGSRTDFHSRRNGPNSPSGRRGVRPTTSTNMNASVSVSGGWKNDGIAMVEENVDDIVITDR